jgi:hypothetical protein
VAPPRLAAVANSGIGLRVEDAPEQFLQLLKDPSRAEPGTSAKPTGSESGSDRPSDRAYRIRVKKSGSARSRTLRVAAQSEHDACAAVLAELGETWSVLEVVRG